MIYHDSHSERMPKHTLWRKITLPETVVVSIPWHWCVRHESDGRFYRRKRTEYHYDGHHVLQTLWYFEFEEDAVLFALKFSE